MKATTIKDLVGSSRAVLKAFLLIISICVAAAFVLPATTSPAHADTKGTKVKYAKKLTLQYAKASATDNCYYIDLGSKAKKAKKITISSSNKAVAAQSAKYKKMPVVKVKKAGTATLTIKVTKKNKKVAKYKTKVTVVAAAEPFESPFASVTALGQDVTNLFKRDEYGDIVAIVPFNETSPQTGTIQIVPHDNWVIDDISYEADYYGEDPDYEDVYETLNNGDSFTVYPKELGYNFMAIAIHMSNSLTSEGHYYTIRYENGFKYDF